jgi:hypothetical protein
MIFKIYKPIPDCAHEPENAHLWPWRLYYIGSWKNMPGDYFGLWGWHLWYYGPDGGVLTTIYFRYETHRPKSWQ